MNRRAVVSIRPEDAGNKVLGYLTNRFTYHDVAQWQTIVRAGKVLLNGQAARPDDRLAPGDTLAYVNFDTAEPPVQWGYTVLFEDAHLLVVDKPGNLPCHPGGRYFRHTLWHVLKTEHGLSYLSFVNRIDRETSGLVLVAKTPSAARNCRRQFDDGSVGKRYLAAVDGMFPERAIRAAGFLCRDETSPVRKKQRFFPVTDAPPVPPGARQCCTVFQRVARQGLRSLVAAQPVTGRLHQIRATLFSLGYPVVGDKIYGADDTFFIRFIDDQLTEEDRRRLVLPRQALHAESLQLRHPATGDHLHVSAPVPEDMAGLFDGSGKRPCPPGPGTMF